MAHATPWWSKWESRLVGRGNVFDTRLACLVRSLGLIQELDGVSVNTSEHYEVIVVGAGQAGLAIGYFLSLEDRRFVILEAETSVASAWRSRWDSLILFTPRRYDSLPGRAFPGDPDGYPTRDEVIVYLDDYAEALALPVQRGSAVRSLTKKGDAFEIVLDDRTVGADQVVVATGPFQRPRHQSSPATSIHRCFRCTAPITAARPRSREGQCWSSAAGTRATRSRANSRQRTTSISPSVAARRRCRRDSSAETSSGGL